MNATELPPAPPETVAIAVAVERPAPPIHTTVLPVALVALDIEIREKYLSADLTVICEAAQKANSTVLTASAGFPLENREKSFAIWRKEGLSKLSAAGLGVNEFLSEHPDFSAEFAAGTIDLLALDRALHDDREAKNQARMERLASQKEALREALFRNIGTDGQSGFPHAAVVRGDGAIKLFKSQQKGKEWGRAGGTGYWMIPIAADGIRRHLPDE